ncbi:MAG: CBS domain-containing protein [Deltaproteobacteria bacterium]|nr:CBS domain-containing protein [Deltaproteobacteria bacterium]
MSVKQVGDLMTRDVAVINRKSDVHELEKLLLERRVHGLPVVNDDGILVGVISQTDLLAWHYNTGVDGAAFYDNSRLVLRQLAATRHRRGCDGWIAAHRHQDSSGRGRDVSDGPLHWRRSAHRGGCRDDG